jgi:hypothetical protein
VHYDPQSSRLSVVNEDLVRAVEEKIKENRRFTITPLSLHFPQISRSLLHKIVSEVKEACFPSQVAPFYDEGIQKLVQRFNNGGNYVKKVVYSMYIKWQYTWFVIYYCFFLNSLLELTFCITLVYENNEIFLMG